MRILILSDLHLEFGDFEPAKVNADVVVLAGDIHTKRRQVDWAAAAFSCPVVLVPGNHDYHGEHFHTLADKLKVLAQGTNVHVLQRDEVRIGGVRFLGGTCWTDYELSGNGPLAQWDAERCMRDFKKIRYGLDLHGNEQYHRLHAYHLVTEHHRFRTWLRARLAEPFAGKTVVVTHHAPSELSVPLIRRQTERQVVENAAYASRMEAEMGGVDLWAHGHTHDQADYEVMGTRVVCNPRGYVGEALNPEFKRDFVIEL